MLQLEFHNNGVASLRVIKEYLEDGPDICTADRLRRYATQETGTHKAYDFLLVVSRCTKWVYILISCCMD